MQTRRETDLNQPAIGTRLSGKYCLVTAAAAGIGRASALAFAREGATVLATDINSSALSDLSSASGSLKTAVLDVTDPQQIFQLLAAKPGIDVLFNCAGHVRAGDILNTDEAAWKRSFAINVDGMYHLCKAVLPGMLDRHSGSIINMSSVVSSVKGAPNRFSYGATKAAVIGLTKAIAADFVGRGVRCNAICPGTVKTPSLGERVAAAGSDESALGEAAEIASLAVYLASDESSFTTGAIHVIDGGWST